MQQFLGIGFQVSKQINEFHTALRRLRIKRHCRFPGSHVINHPIPEGTKYVGSQKLWCREIGPFKDADEHVMNNIFRVELGSPSEQGAHVVDKPQTFGLNERADITILHFVLQSS
jgi:hypothetical protein